MTTRWQRLGGWIATSANLQTEQLDGFRDVGGAWIVPVIYGDDASGPTNLANLGWLKAACFARGIEVGGWFNCWGGTVEKQIQYAEEISNLVLQHNLKIVILDLEAAYQYPKGTAELMPFLVKSLRGKLPNRDIGVSTNGMNSSMIWNGRNLIPPQSFYDFGIRVLPQWYNSPRYTGCWTDPVCNMKWLKENGSTDFNFKDPNAKRTRYRGLPLSYVHPTLEVTGLEDARLLDELNRCMEARKYGLTPGISLYLLENTPFSDWEVLKPFKDRLWIA